MKVFSNYAQYYDLLNKEKDYNVEVQYILSLLKQFTPETKSILDLGCGTGLHAINFVKNGYSIHGVDQSNEMISIANKRLLEQSNSTESVNFSVGDIRNVSLGKMFDTVISLFHVMSYQITNDDLIATLQTVDNHLNNGGLFIFDCWYGPAVLADKPYQRKKIFEDDGMIVKRTSNPVMYPSKNIIDINFDIEITNKITDNKDNIKELHKMRYLFEPEMDILLKNQGFEILKTEEWLTRKNPSNNSWYVTFICKKT